MILDTCASLSSRSARSSSRSRCAASVSPYWAACAFSLSRVEAGTLMVVAVIF